MNNCKGKIIVFDGDSICHGGRTNVNGEYVAWAGRVGESLEMDWYNYSIGGATIAAETYSAATGEKKHWITRYIDEIHEKHPKLDYFIFEGGTNDADILGVDSDRFGTFEPFDYSGNYDDTTFTGGFETLIFKALNYYPALKIGYIVAQKMGDPNKPGTCFHGRRQYFLRAIEICKKWGVPYLDLWESSPLNPALKCYYDPALTKEENISAGKAYKDGQHLTPFGYDILGNRISSFVESL